MCAGTPAQGPRSPGQAERGFVQHSDRTVGRRTSACAAARNQRRPKLFRVRRHHANVRADVQTATQLAAGSKSCQRVTLAADTVLVSIFVVLRTRTLRLRMLGGALFVIRARTFGVCERQAFDRFVRAAQVLEWRDQKRQAQQECPQAPHAKSANQPDKQGQAARGCASRSGADPPASKNSKGTLLDRQFPTLDCP